MSPLPLRRRRALPLCELAASGRYPCGLVVLKQPLAGAVLQAVVPAVAYRPCELATTGRPLCRRPGRGWPRIHLLAVFATKTQEIVYPCIPDPDGEDEGGQASSSLAVSKRWISAAKLLQFDLVTPTQREG
ncbi:hypothetical protein B296_00048028 [Ensete ventricosum]|uniref:Uncharacterized protein n=1 Tax=Ensete ventricosum TaxID=4639 RepID=A0A426YG33_ENSVE|nr:hypothetical protein B296_00048028 [Ensete ventricosum]